ncbi:MAG: hypothetical protein J7M38_04240 [Armatimonadetes bacterium]|nr:hypothetical protein [Armatimonadota bacterium]
MTRSAGFAVMFTALIAAMLLAPTRALCVEKLQAGEHTVIVDDRGRISVRHGRVEVVTTSYGGMFGRLPSGAPIYWIDAARHLQVERVEEAGRPPSLVIANSGDRGVTMRREVILEEGGVRLVHELDVPAGVPGSIDTGFTLNPALTFDAQVSVWSSPDAEPVKSRLGAGEDCLPYRSDFQKIAFDGQWGTLTIEFDTSEGLQGHGAVLNFPKSASRPSMSVQILPLFAGVKEGQPAATFRSSCLVHYEPKPGKTYLSPRRNLLYNGGFEDWSNPDLPDGWRRSPYATEQTSAGLAPDAEVKFEGGRSLRWSLDGGTLSHITARNNYFAPGQVVGPLVFSIYLRSEPPGVQVALRCGRWRQQVEAGTDWQRFPVIAESGVGGRAFSISIEKLSKGTLWLDAAQLEEGDAPTPYVARERSTVFADAPFPEVTMAADIEQLLQQRPALRGPGPELSYYTSERSGRLVYDLDLSPAQRTTASLTVQLTDPGGATVKEQTLGPPLERRAVMQFDVARLPVGTCHARAVLTAGEETLGELEHEVVKLPPLRDGVEVKINRLTRTLVRGGRPYIPVGSDATSSVDRALECIRGQAANGFNQLHLWSGFAEFIKTGGGNVPELHPEDLLRILDAAHQAGMTVTVNLSHWLSINHFHQARFQNMNISDEEIIRRAVETVRVARSHPALLTWHLLDEPNPAYCTPEWAQRIYNAVHEADPYHPIEINVCATGRNMLAYTCASDLMSIDIYPVPRSHIGIIAPHTRFMRLADEWRPIRWWIQSFAGVREPTALEESCMTYQAIVEGTRFILFYNYRPTSYAAWAGLGQIARELKELNPALAVERADVPVTAAEGERRVIASLSRVGDRVHVIAVNRDTQPMDAEPTLPLDCAGRSAEVMFEGRSVTAAGRILADRFAPMARHVYRFEL